jgi:DNA helicase-2/ATP-dependent DNA helicase PcrA
VDGKMSIDSLLAELNTNQRIAACIARQHALILAGAGTGKTKTIVARAAYLISSGTPAHRIQIMAFTRRAAAEIVGRVKMHLGDAAQGLNASTFHAWCMHQIHRAPQSFGCKGYSVIDQEDQQLLFKILRGAGKQGGLPTASQIHDLYSLARNTLHSLDSILQDHAPEFYQYKIQLANIMLGYEGKKRERRYLDYDDILDVVAQRLEASADTRDWLANLYDHILIDEMQDTNPLQWKLISPLLKHVSLYCVGDDAQSIYGFRGADFRNVHSFSSRVEGSVILKLEDNYRSTQELLDVANWLLARSPLGYDKKLRAVRGNGKQPHLHTFSNEFEEANWIAQDLLSRREEGAEWRNHMILVRSAYAARALQASLLAKNIPYSFVGGVKLLESAHVRDLLSVLRLVANPKDEIGWMRFLTLWKGVGDVTASRLIERVMSAANLDQCFEVMLDEPKLAKAAFNTVVVVKDLQNDVAMALSQAYRAMEDILATKYRNQEWDKRRNDFSVIEKLAEKHSSILEFIEAYVLDPVYVTAKHLGQEKDDVVTVITIHSAKGTEREVCYVLNVSPQAYPLSSVVGNLDKVEEERRVLYVALTRAKDELIVTRHCSIGNGGYTLWAYADHSGRKHKPETYFFNALPRDLFIENIHQEMPPFIEVDAHAPEASKGFAVGIKID